MLLTYSILNSQLTLVNGMYTDIDVKNRPYLLKYNINKIDNTSIMGCQQSRCLKSESLISIRPNRSTTRKSLSKNVDNLLHSSSNILLDVITTDIKLDSTSFIINENYYDKLSNIGDIIINTDIIIITKSSSIIRIFSK